MSQTIQGYTADNGKVHPTFTTELDVETAIYLAGTTGEFGRKMAGIAARGKASAKVWYWVWKLAEDKKNPSPRRESVDLGDFARIVQLLVTAAAHMKYPKIRLSVGDQPVVLSLAGQRSKRPGTINVTDGGRYGENKWFGRIEKDGSLSPGRELTEPVTDLLKAFANDPEGIASAYGKLTGNCCFCARELTDKRSTDVGYGPICADHYGLAWG